MKRIVICVFILLIAFCILYADTKWGNVKIGKLASGTEEAPPPPPPPSDSAGAEWNIDDKRFNQRYVGKEAYLIENGELKHPVARPIIETSTLKFWGAVDAISKKVEFDAATCGKGDPMQGIPVYTGGPSIRLRDVHVK